MVGGKFEPPTIQTPVNLRNFVELYIRSLKTYKSLSNLASVLTLQCSFQWCKKIFPNMSMSKVEKTKKGSIMTKGAALDLTVNTFRVLSSPALTILQLSV